MVVAATTCPADNEPAMTPPIVTCSQPRTLVFGAGCAARCAEDLLARDARRAFVVTSPSAARHGDAIFAPLRRGGTQLFISDGVRAEPTVDVFREALAAARDARADCVIGLGGG